MTYFRILLALLWLIVTGYTAATVADHGFNFFPAFFGDVTELAWPGQFNVDFSSFLILAATWIAWRHNFSISGILLALISPFGGMIFLSTYLLIITAKNKLDMPELLLGKTTASALKH